jgi:HptB-dependent secretion and biofilm anti anti-sigma factor
MGMSIKTQITHDKAKLSLQGRFDFSAHRDFRQGYEGLLKQPGVTSLEIDLRDINYIDSSALGMLLVLKETVAKSRQQLTIANCTGSIRKVLEVANFDKLFTLS